MTTILTTLGYGDLPFNAGIWRPLEIDVGEPGTVVNAQPPAPVTSGHAVAGMRVTRAVKDLLDQACGLSEDPVLRGRVGGLAHDSILLNPLAGLGHGGVPDRRLLHGPRRPATAAAPRASSTARTSTG